MNGEPWIQFASCCLPGSDLPSSSPSPQQEKNNQEIDLNYKLKTLQQRLEQEQTEHRVTRAQLTDKYESIEEAKSAAMNGMPVLCQSTPHSLYTSATTFPTFLCLSPPLLYLASSSPHDLCPALFFTPSPDEWQLQGFDFGGIQGVLVSVSGHCFFAY